MKSTRICTIGLALLLVASAALASWYDDYDKGIIAAHKGDWKAVIQSMTAAINAHPNEGNKERTYGMGYSNYHPYYYRGYAYLKTGKYDQAIADFEKTAGPGEENLGPLETLMQSAKSKLEAMNTPEPQPVQPQPVRPAPVPVPVPAPVQPAAPVIDPAIRQQAAAAISQAKARITAAQQRKAGNTTQYNQAMQALTDAINRSTTPRSNDDLNTAIALANNAVTYADLAPAPGAPTPKPTIIPTRPTQASALVLADSSKRVRDALESYFRGDFDEASTKFQRLSSEMPANGWIWAFLGASQYSQYAFEADKSYEREAMESFRKAKNLRKWNGGLPQRYFSKKIRKVFESAS